MMNMMNVIPTPIDNQSPRLQHVHRPAVDAYLSPPSSSASSAHCPEDLGSAVSSTGSTLDGFSGSQFRAMTNSSVTSSPGVLLPPPAFQHKTLLDTTHHQRTATPPQPPAYFATPAVSQPPQAPMRAVTLGASALKKRSAPLNAPYRHQPYAALPPHPPAAAARSNHHPVMHGISHQPLVGTCRYVSWPDITPLPTPPVNYHPGLPRLVIDQVKFELTASQLRWLIYKLSGVVAVHVVALERGGFAGFFKNESDRARAQSLHRAVLFDHNGAWAPANATESAAVSRYMAAREFRQRGQRLPRELMTLVPKSAVLSPTGSTSGGSASTASSSLLPPY